MFETPTKTGTKGNWGLEGLARIRACSRHALVAIGGIHLANVHDVIASGADAVAVVSAVCAVPDPEKASQELCACICPGREVRS